MNAIYFRVITDHQDFMQRRQTVYSYLLQVGITGDASGHGQCITNLKTFIEMNKTKVKSFRFDIDLEEFVESHENKSEFINSLVRKEKERLEAIEASKVKITLKNMGL